MRALTAVLGFAILAIVVADAFRTVIVARHAQKLHGVTRLVIRLSWLPLAAVARRIKSRSGRERYLGLYGPLSLLLLLGFWASNLILAFAVLQWSADLHLGDSPAGFANDIYFSAATFFTLGAGEPRSLLSKYLMVLEAGSGFSFLGLVIGYLPVLYQTFSAREFRILLLDARAGSPPSAVEFIKRLGNDREQLEKRLADWEDWAVTLLENHLSYPMLAYYRSHHANQSWLAALTTIIDVSALVMLSAEGDLRRQAEFTFAAVRHALVHTASVFRTRERHPPRDRLPAEDFLSLCSDLSADNTFLQVDRIPVMKLQSLRAMYEPQARGLGEHFLMALPPWLAPERVSNNWEMPS